MQISLVGYIIIRKANSFLRFPFSHTAVQKQSGNWNYSFSFAPWWIARSDVLM